MGRFAIPEAGLFHFDREKIPTRYPMIDCTIDIIHIKGNLQNNKFTSTHKSMNMQC